MCQPGLGLLPIALGLMMGTAIVVSYIVAVLRGDVEAFFPYISDTGTTVPESSIFGQFLNMAAFLAGITMFARYKLLFTLVNEDEQMAKTLKVGKINLWIGFVAALGLMLVANFQEDKIEVVHLIGASMVFGFGVIYEFIDSWISHKCHPTYNEKCICRVRLSLAFISLFSLIITGVAGSIARGMWNHSKPDHRRIHWKPTDPGYVPHIMSTFGEWIMAISFLLYFFSYIRDFHNMTFELKAYVNVQHLNTIQTANHEPNEATKLLV